MDKPGRTLYVSDLDGTLLGHDDRISARSLKILNSLIERGLAFTYATARSLRSAQAVTQGLQLCLPVIVYNGCMLVCPDDERAVYSLAFSQTQCARLRTIAEESAAPVLVYARIDGAERVSWISGKENNGLLHYLSNRKNDPRLRAVDCFDELFAGEPFYFTFIGEQAALRPCYDALRADRAFTCTFQQELYRPEYWFEVMPREATKANAARKLKQMLGFSRIVAFGDAVNDLSLFEAVDQAYAVDNAAAVLKSRADAVLAANDADGVALWLAAHSGIPI